MLIVVVQLLIYFQNKTWRVPAHREEEEGWQEALRAPPSPPPHDPIFPDDDMEEEALALDHDRDSGYASDGGVVGVRRDFRCYHQFRIGSPSIVSLLEYATYRGGLSHEDVQSNWEEGRDRMFPIVLDEADLQSVSSQVWRDIVHDHTKGEDDKPDTPVIPIVPDPSDDGSETNLSGLVSEDSEVESEGIDTVDLTSPPASPGNSSGSSGVNYDEDAAYADAVLKRDLPEAVWE